MKKLFTIIIYLTAIMANAQQDYLPSKENLEARKWFEEAKFGLFFIGVFIVF